MAPPVFKSLSAQHYELAPAPGIPFERALDVVLQLVVAVLVAVNAFLLYDALHDFGRGVSIMLDILLRSARLSGMLALGLFLLMPIASARAAATAVNACQTLSAPGNYLVTSDLTASGDCFTLTVSNIAIDMQGHKIVGNGSGAAITDGGNSIRYIIVANGKISNFAKGIDLSSDSGQTADLILNVNVSGNTGDGINIRGRDNSLTSVIANNNGGNGIVQGNCCNSIFNVETNGNAGDGINLSSEDYLKNVTSNGNGGNGVIGSSDSFVVLSIANQNASPVSSCKMATTS